MKKNNRLLNMRFGIKILTALLFISFSFSDSLLAQTGVTIGTPGVTTSHVTGATSTSSAGACSSQTIYYGSNWTSQATNYWEYDVDVAGYSSITFTTQHTKGSGTGPANMEVYYWYSGITNTSCGCTLDGNGDADAGFGYVVTTSCTSLGTLGPLPTAANNHSLAVKIKSKIGTAGISSTFGSGGTNYTWPTLTFIGNCMTPTAYTVSSASACTSSNITLSGSDAWCKYVLYCGATAVQTINPGTGSALTFTSTLTAGTYSVVATNIKTGCTATANMTGTVVLTAYPTPSISGTPLTFCTGSSVTLSASPTGSYTYQWKNAGGSITGATNATYSANATGNYSVTVTPTAASCPSTSATAAVNVVSYPTPTISGSPLTFCSGSSVTLSASPTGSYTYQWLNGGGSISGATNATYSANATGNYSVTVTPSAASCPSTSATAAVNVVSAPTVTTQPSTTLTTNNCSASTISAIFSGSPTSYQWYKSTTSGGSTYAAISGTTDGTGTYTGYSSSATLSLTNPPTTISGFNYICVATNACGSVTTNACVPTVTACAGSITTTPAGFGPFCNTSDNTFTVNYSFTGTYTANFTAQLSDATGSFLGTPLTIGTSAATTSTSISVTIPSGTTASSSYRIRIINSTPLTLGSDNGSNISIVAPATAGSVTSNQTICYGAAPASLSLGGYTGTITGWQSDTDPAFSTPAPTSIATTTATYSPSSPLSTTYYRAVVNNSTCTTSVYSSAATISINPLPTVTTQPGTTLSTTNCTSSSISAIFSGATSYLWYKSTTSGGSTYAAITGTTDGTGTYTNYTTASLTLNNPPTTISGYNYRCVATNACGSVTTNVCVPTVTACPTITTTPTAYGPYCNASSNTFAVAYTYVGTYTSNFTAQLSDATGSFVTSPTTIGTSASTTSTSMNVTIPSGTTPGTNYRIRIINTSPAITGTDNGSDITIYGAATGGSVTSNQTICAGVTPASLTLGSYSGTIYSWQSDTDPTFTSPTPTTIATTTATYSPSSPSATTYYRAVITNGSCTAYSTAASISVNPLPSVAAISPASGTICLGTATPYTDATTSGGTYTWSCDNTAVATIDPSTGIATGITAGSANIAYSFTNTATGCYSTLTTPVTVSYVPSSVSVSPGSASLCPSSTAQALSTIGGTITGTVTVTSGSISLAVPKAGMSTSLTPVLPSGATITGVSVSFNASAGYESDNSFNLQAPNGQIINLVYEDGGTSSAGFYNTVISSAGGITFSSDAPPYTNTHTADNIVSFSGSHYTLISSSYLPTTTTWSSLYGTTTGAWSLIGCNYYSNTATTLTSWSIAISYSLPVTYTWSPYTALYTNSGASSTYGGTNLSTVYSLPATGSSYTYTVTAAYGSCTTTGTSTVSRSSTVTVPAIATATTGGHNVCNGTPDTLYNSQLGGTWSYTGSTAMTTTNLGVIGTNQAVAVNGTSSGTGTVTYTYTNSCGSASANYTVTANVLPTVSSISGLGSTICTSTPVGLTDGTTGTHTWSSANTAIATIDASSGILTGISSGTSVITYTYNNGTCSNYTTATATVSYSPTAVSVSPVSVNMCPSGTPVILTASGSTLPTPGTATVSSGTINLTGLTSSHGTSASTLNVAGIPASATVNSISVTLNFQSNYIYDYVFNLQAPNSKILNLINNKGPNTSTVNYFTNTVINSASTSPLAAGSGTYTATFGADLQNGVPSGGVSTPISNTILWSDLYSTLNGNWVLSGYNISTFTNSSAQFTSWSMTINYTYNAAQTYTWANTTGLFTNSSASTGYTGSTTTTVYTQPASTTVYTVTSTNGACTTTNTVNVTVSPNPTITPGGPTTFCSGGSVVLSASPTGSAGTYAYQWSNSSGTITGATNSTFTASMSSSYSVTVTNVSASCSNTSAGTTVTVVPYPTPSISGSPLTFCSGSNVTLSASPTGSYSYQWLNGGGSISGATNATYSASTSDNYSVTVTPSAASCPSTSATTTVNVVPFPTPAISGSPLTFCSGSNVTLSASPTGSYTYQWKNGSGTISGATNATYSANATGNYSVTVTPSAASCPSTSATTTVNVVPFPSASVAASGPTTFCSGTNVALNASPTGSYTYQWLNGGGFISGATNATYSANATGNYSVTVTPSAASCPNTSSATNVTVDATPSLGAIVAGVTNICAGNPVTLSETGTPSAPSTGTNVYTWTGPMGIIGTVATITSSSYFSFLPGGSSYSGVYTLSATYSETGCTASNVMTSSITVGDIPTLSLSLSYPGIICNGLAESFSVTATGGLGSPVYTWSGPGIATTASTGTLGNYSVVPTYAGVYTVTATYSVTGCGPVSTSTSTITPTAQVWTGASTYEWGNTANWACGILPSVTDSIMVPFGTTNLPLIEAGGTYNLKVLSLAPGTVLTLNSGSKLVLAGNLTNSGNIIGDGLISMAGSSAQKIYGYGSVNNLEINNSHGVAVNSSADSVTLTGYLSLLSGNFSTHDNLILSMSDDPYTNPVNGRINAISAGTGTITGQVIDQQFIKGGRRAWRLWGHPFMDSIPLSQLENYMDITGLSGSLHGFTNTSTNNPSAFWYHTIYSNSSTPSSTIGWMPFTWCKDSISGTTHVSRDSNLFHRFQGIRLFFRGDKGEGLDGTAGYTIDPVTVRMWGHVNTGDLDVPLHRGDLTSSTGAPLQDYNIISNPYPCPVDFGLVFYNAVVAGQVYGTTFWVNNTFGGTTGTVIGQDESTYTPFIIPANASVEVRAAFEGAKLHFTESCKAATPTLELMKSQKDAFTLNIYDESNRIWDLLTFKFNDTANDAEERNLDAGKPSNPDLNFYSWSSDHQALSKDSRPYQAGKVIQLGLVSNYLQSFVMKVDNFSVPQGGQVYLHDKYLGKYTLLTQGTEYKFEVTKDPASQGDNRFELGMQPADAKMITNTSTVLNVMMLPNPASNSVTVTFNAPNVAKTSIKILSAEGIVVLHQELGEMQNGQATLPVDNLASGIYMVEFTSGNETVVSRLVKE